MYGLVTMWYIWGILKIYLQSSHLHPSLSTFFTVSGMFKPVPASRHVSSTSSWGLQGLSCIWKCQDCKKVQLDVGFNMIDVLALPVKTWSQVDETQVPLKKTHCSRYQGSTQAGSLTTAASTISCKVVGSESAKCRMLTQMHTVIHIQHECKNDIKVNAGWAHDETAWFRVWGPSRWKAWHHFSHNHESREGS